MDCKQPYGKGLGDIDKRKIGHEAVKCICSPESQWHLELQKRQTCGQYVEGDDFPSLLCVDKTSPG